MKFIAKSVYFGAVILGMSCMSLSTQAAEKIGFINTAAVFHALPQREVVTNKLKQEFKDRSAQLQSLEKSLKDKVAELKRNEALMTSQEKEALQIEIGRLDSEFKIKRQAFQRDSMQREDQEKQKLLKLIHDAVTKIANKEGYDLVIDTQALQFANPKYDLSDKVIQALK